VYSSKLSTVMPRNEETCLMSARRTESRSEEVGARSAVSSSWFVLAVGLSRELE
jgi:hypothetical protein